jgi:hypothetical protein
MAFNTACITLDKEYAAITIALWRSTIMGGNTGDWHQSVCSAMLGRWDADHVKKQNESSA